MFCPKSVWKKYKIKRIRSDNCTEYVNHELSKYVSLNTHMYRNGVLFQECLRYFKSSLIHCLAKSQFEKKKRKKTKLKVWIMNSPNFCPLKPTCTNIEYFFLELLVEYTRSIEHVHTWYIFRLTLGTLVLQK